ncbi:NAD(P)H dehydrogenase (quinone) [Thermocatellispora tengchongensis]|uniref:NAD(P)H dehydrogenase (Quinone) n=1 Tax=Thermocatellispora tengchongensis TaxID=1073253 RepID=A0A840PD00_9ACTN|nr:NAD(P)H-binding protein [Thermocatellispora tengchongensis]MBB5136586.1 NAD(P)H dehydrogenase (quinone) [Thermocatellispora tengchongensis]
MTVAITGASGPLGRSTADHLLRLAGPTEVVLATRRPDALADLAARGAGVRRVDFTEPGTFATAFAGVDRLLIISTDAIGARLDQHRAAIEGAAAAGVRHIVYTSVPEPVPANPALVVADHAGTEQALYDSGLTWTVLRNNLYAHMQIPVIEQAITSGRLVTNGGDGATAYVTREDCAAVAAAVLTQDGHEDRVYDVTGPEALTAADLAALAGEVGGRPVEPVALDDDAMAAGLRAAGAPEEAAELVVSFGAATRLGFLAHVSSTVADLTGRPATPLADLLRTVLPAR